ncbi:MAG: radical SAM protein, partial [Proteobacteria bacterium]|nr:radical SAM protein [Pseudomonadota bacterium]
MKFKPELQAEIDEQGRLVLPKELLSRLGLKPGDKVPVSQGTNSISVHQPVTHLKKVYIEPTSQCNLTCRTCIRNSWSEPMGQMSLSTFNLAIESLRAFSPSPTIVFGGFGEPLFHPHIIDMIKKAKANGSPVELITNGTLLTEQLSRELLAAGIDVLWISLDGASPESYADVRHGAALPDVLANVSRLRYSSWASQYRQPHIGVVFVAMKSTIADLPKVLGIGQHLLADRYIITNVLPYTKELCSEVLYSSVLGDVSGVPSPWTPDLNFSKIDMNE